MAKQPIQDHFSAFLAFDSKRTSSIFYKANQEYISLFLIDFLELVDQVFADKQQKQLFLDFLRKSPYSHFDLCQETIIEQIAAQQTQWKTELTKLQPLLKNQLNGSFELKEWQELNPATNVVVDKSSWEPLHKNNKATIYCGNLQGNTFSTYLQVSDETRQNLKTNWQFLFWMFKHRYLDEQALLAADIQTFQQGELISKTEMQMANQSQMQSYPTQFHVPFNRLHHLSMNHWVSPYAIAFYLKDNQTQLANTLFFDFLKTIFSAEMIFNLNDEWKGDFQNTQSTKHYQWNDWNVVSPILNGLNLQNIPFVPQNLIFILKTIAKTIMTEFELYEQTYEPTEQSISHFCNQYLQTEKLIQAIMNVWNDEQSNQLPIVNTEFVITLPDLAPLLAKSDFQNRIFLADWNAIGPKIFLWNFYNQPELIGQIQTKLEQALQANPELTHSNNFTEAQDLINFYAQWSQNWNQIPKNDSEKNQANYFIRNAIATVTKEVPDVAAFCQQRPTLSLNKLGMTFSSARHSRLETIWIEDFVRHYIIEPFKNNLWNNYSQFSQQAMAFCQQIQRPSITKVVFDDWNKSRKTPASSFHKSVVDKNHHKYIRILNALHNQHTIKPFDQCHFIDFRPNQEQKARFRQAHQFLQKLTLDEDQQKIVAAPLRGQSVIIEGPAGTGKTQTLNNILKTLAATALKVLVVTNNEPALEIVEDRFKKDLKVADNTSQFFQNQLFLNPHLKSTTFAQHQQQWYDNIPLQGQTLLNPLKADWPLKPGYKNVVFAALSQEKHDAKLYKMPTVDTNQIMKLIQDVEATAAIPQPNSDRWQQGSIFDLPVSPNIQISNEPLPHFSKYDVILFDEASLIPYNKAALLFHLAPVKIITGDSKQLPPTFSRSDDEYAVQHNIKNIDLLHWAKTNTNFPQLNLKNNYRSEMKDLLAFSSRFVYNDQLNTLSKNWQVDPSKLGYGLDFTYVGGTFNNQANHDEINIALQKTIYRMSQNVIHQGEETILILTGNKEQAKQMKITFKQMINLMKQSLNPAEPQMIWNQLFVAQKYTNIKRYFSDLINEQDEQIIQNHLDSEYLALPGRLQKLMLAISKTMQFFIENDEEKISKTIAIKDIEAMQGAEADHVIMSLAYGPNKRGTLIHRFGEFSEAHVLNFINVISTRASKSFNLLSSIQPEELQSDRLNEYEQVFQRWLRFHKDYGKQEHKTTTDISDHANEYTEQIQKIFTNKEVKAYTINEVAFDAIIADPNHHYIELLIKILPAEQQNQQANYWTTKLNLFDKRGYKMLLIDPKEISRLSEYNKTINIKKL